MTNFQTKNSSLITTPRPVNSDTTSDAHESIRVTFDGTEPKWWTNGVNILTMRTLPVLNKIPFQLHLHPLADNRSGLIM